MTQAQDEILRMIENVDPSDTTKMDEIDIGVEVFVLGMTFDRDESGRRFHEISTGKCYVQEPAQYTRSRDALKAIRPDGWIPFLAKWYASEEGFAFTIENAIQIEGPFCKTEELAELWTIISAIAHERTHHDR